VGWQDSQRFIEDSSNGMAAAMLELAERLRRRSLHKKEKPHERTSFVRCVAKSLTPEGVSYRAPPRGLAEDTHEHAGGVFDLEIAFVLGESDFTEGFGAAHADDGEALRVVNAAGAGGKNP